MMNNKIPLCWFFFLVIFPLYSGVSQEIDQVSQCEVNSFYSYSLQEERQYCVYLPPQYQKQQQYPVVYFADGQEFMNCNYQQLLDSLIDAKLINPVIAVGIFSNEKTVPTGHGVQSSSENIQYRNLEYLEFWDIKDNFAVTLFENHLKFFVNEMLPYIENEYSISSDRENRIFYGFSNGAVFGLSICTRFPQLFSKYILFSPYGVTQSKIASNKDFPTNFYIAFGTEEPDFIVKNAIESLEKSFKKSKNPYKIILYEGGHEKLKWKKEFGNLMVELLKEY